MEKLFWYLTGSKEGITDASSILSCKDNILGRETVSKERKSSQGEEDKLGFNIENKGGEFVSSMNNSNGVLDIASSEFDKDRPDIRAKAIQ
jgi:hypothetical protein